MLEVFLVNGQRLVGRIRSFDRFSMLLDMPQGGCFVFHHTVSTVQPAGKGTRRPPRAPGARDSARDQSRSGQLDEGASRRDPAQPRSYASGVGISSGRHFPSDPAPRRGPPAPAPVVKIEKRKRRIISRDPE